MGKFQHPNKKKKSAWLLIIGYCNLLGTCILVIGYFLRRNPKTGVTLTCYRYCGVVHVGSNKVLIAQGTDTENINKNRRFSLICALLKLLTLPFSYDTLNLII